MVTDLPTLRLLEAQARQITLQLLNQNTTLGHDTDDPLWETATAAYYTARIHLDRLVSAIAQAESEEREAEWAAHWCLMSLATDEVPY